MSWLIEGRAGGAVAPPPSPHTPHPTPVLHFKTNSGTVQAVDGVDFELDTNRAVVILGESGCGKSSLAKAILRLLPRNVEAYGGSVYLQGTNVMIFDEEQFRQNVRWAQISLVPQAAMNSLNPVLRVGDQVAEPAMVHLGIKKEEAIQLAKRMFQHVGVPEDFLSRYPFELSGGMRQRVALAMALVTSPSLIVLDEPTSALDLLTQANIMNVLKRIKHSFGTSYILNTHDIATSSDTSTNIQKITRDLSSDLISWSVCSLSHIFQPMDQQNFLIKL